MIHAGGLSAGLFCVYVQGILNELKIENPQTLNPEP